MVVLPDYFKKKINECGITNFPKNENGEITNQYFNEFIDMEIRSIIAKPFENADFYIKTKIMSESMRTFFLRDAQKMFMIYALINSIQIYITSKQKNMDESCKTFTSISEIALQNYLALISLYLSGFDISVVSQMRVLYENYVVFYFLATHKNFIEPFIDHGELTKFVINEEYGDLSHDEQMRKEELIKKYNAGFSKPYSWAKTLFPEKNKIKINDLADCVNITGFDPIYKLASNFIHTNSYVLDYKDGINENYLSQISKCAIGTMVNMYSNLIMQTNYSDKEKNILDYILNGVHKKMGV
jgi:hypothetical protein